MVCKNKKTLKNKCVVDRLGTQQKVKTQLQAFVILKRNIINNSGCVDCMNQKIETHGEINFEKQKTQKKCVLVGLVTQTDQQPKDKHSVVNSLSNINLKLLPSVGFLK